MPKVILHAGLHKTGTTAIQDFAHLNREALRRQGVVYPGYSDALRTVSTGHHEFAHAVAGKGKRLEREDARRLAQQWLGDLDDSRERLLISAEAMSRHIVPAGRKSWVAKRAAYLEMLAGMFPGAEIEVVIVIRRQDNFIRSLYFENVAGGHRNGRLSFAAYRRRMSRKRARFEKNLALFEKRFASLKVHVYEDMVDDNDICRGFFSQLGVETSGMKQVGRVRESLGPAQIELKRLLNHRSDNLPDNETLNEWLQSPVVTEVLERHVDVRNASPWESLQARIDYLESFADETERIRQKYLPHKKTLFPSFEPDGREGNVVRLDSALLADLIVMLMQAPGKR